MYRAVIWDLDGTLLNTSVGVIEAVECTLQQLNLEKPENVKLQEFVGPPMQNSFCKFFNMKEDEALIAANLFRDNYKNSVLHAEIYPGIVNLLEKLKQSKVVMAVATNKSHDNASTLLQNCGIADYCEYIIGSDRSGKLDKGDLINKCLHKLHVDAKQALYIGDSSLDYEGCEKANVSFLGVTYGFGYKSKTELLETRCIASASDVNELEKKLSKLLLVTK